MLSVIKNSDFLYCFYLFQIFDREYNFHIYIHSFTQFIVITHFHYPYFTLKTYLWVCSIKCSFLFLVNTIDFSWFQIFLDVSFTFMGFYLHYNAIDEERFLWHLRMKLSSTGLFWKCIHPDVKMCTSFLRSYPEVAAWSYLHCTWKLAAIFTFALSLTLNVI